MPEEGCDTCRQPAAERTRASRDPTPPQLQAIVLDQMKRAKGADLLDTFGRAEWIAGFEQDAERQAMAALDEVSRDPPARHRSAVRGLARQPVRDEADMEARH